MFTVGEIDIPPGEPGQLSVVLTGQLDEDGYLPIVVRNNGDQTLYDVGVLLIATDASGAEVAAVDYLISTAGLEPGEWTFGQNAAAAPGLSEATNVQLQFSGSETPVGFVELDVMTAELIGGAIVGTVTNNSETAVGNFNLVNVACFNGPQVSFYELALADTQDLAPGESANFSTTVPIDPESCSAFAVYAVGLADVQPSDVQVQNGSFVTVVPETVVEMITSEVVVETLVEDVDVTGSTSLSALGSDVPVKAMLTAEDLGSDWETEGPETLDFGTTAEPFSYCPNGAEMLPPAAGASISFTPVPTVEDVSLFDDEVVEAVFVFPTAQDLASWFDGLESCVGQEWEESFDPVEHVTLETLDVPNLGDESRGFRTIYAHNEGPEHDNTAILVRLGEVLVLVSYDNYGLDEAVDPLFFDDLVETAVGKVEATLG